MDIHLYMYVLSILMLVPSYSAEEDSNDIGYFWQISDIHHDPDYSVDGDPDNFCHQSLLPLPENITKPGLYGSPLCDSPWTLVESAVDAMKTFKAKPDFILWTGDTSPKKVKSQKEILDIVRKITILLNDTFPSAYLIPVLGNHDVFPRNQMPTSGDFYKEFLKGSGWDKFLNDDGAESFLKGGYYKIMIKPGLSVVVLNTNLHLSWNKLTKDLKDPADQFLWLRRCLDEEQNTKHKVLVVGHVPPGFSELNNDTQWFYPNFNEAYLKIMKEYQDTVKTQIFGHEHEDTFRIFSDEKGRPFSSGFIQSSVVPFMGYRGISVNPTVRLYKYNRDSGSILDIFEYKLDIRTTNKKEKGKWKLEYQGTKEYGLPDLKLKSLKKLATSFMKKGSTNFAKYFSHVDAGFVKNSCDTYCKKLHLCAILHINRNSYEDCIIHDKFFLEFFEEDLVDLEASNENVTVVDGGNRTLYHNHYHQPMPIFVFYIITTLCVLSVIFFLLSAFICIRRRRNPEYVRVVSLSELSEERG